MNGIEACRLWLVDWLDRQPPGARLPAQDLLCRRFAIGKRALRVLIGEFQQAGRLHVRPHSGTWSVGSSAVEPPVVTEPLTHRAARVADALTSDIQRLALPDNTMLPSTRWLARQYHCGTNTMTKALQRLVERRLLERQGRRYHRAAHQRRRRILVVHRTDRDCEILPILEAEAALNGHPVWACTVEQMSELLREATRSDGRPPHVIAVLPNTPTPAAISALGDDQRFGRGPHQARLVHLGSIRQPLPNAIRCATGSRRTQLARTVAAHVQARDSRHLVLTAAAVDAEDNAQFHLCLAIAAECIRLRPTLTVRLLLQAPPSISLDRLIDDADWVRSVLLADGPLVPADLPRMIRCHIRVDQSQVDEACDLLVLCQALPGWRASDRHRRPTLCAFDSPWARHNRLTGIGENVPYLASLLLRACNADPALPRTSRGFIQLPLTMIDREDG